MANLTDTMAKLETLERLVDGLCKDRDALLRLAQQIRASACGDHTFHRDRVIDLIDFTLRQLSIPTCFQPRQDGTDG